MNRSFRQKINHETVSLNDILGQMDLTDILQNIPLQINRTHILFKFTRNILQDNMTGYGQVSINLIKFKSCIFSDHNGIKLEINHKKKKWKTHKGGS